MTTYRVKTGFDQALIDLVDLDPQPDPGPLIEVTERQFAASANVNDQGEYVEFKFSALEDTTAFTTLLTQFGLNSAKQAEVTVYVRNDLLAWVRKNGVAVRPRPGVDLEWGDRQSRPLNVVILVRGLEDAS